MASYSVVLASLAKGEEKRKLIGEINFKQLWMQNNIILRKEKLSQTYKNCPIYEKLKMRNHMTKNTSTYIASNFELVRKDLTKEKNKIKAITAGLPVRKKYASYSDIITTLRQSLVSLLEFFFYI